MENKRRMQSEVNARVRYFLPDSVSLDFIFFLIRRNRSRSSSAGSIGMCPPRPLPSAAYMAQSRRINLGLLNSVHSMDHNTVRS